MTWLINWNRRKQITVNGTTAGAQSNYQMSLTVNQGTGIDSAGNVYLGGNVLSSFADIRFTKSDGTTLLNYWIESISGSSPTQVAKVWVKLAPSPDTIPASPGTYSFYIYYNNPSAIDASNGSNTFVLYTGFHNTSYVSPTLPITGGGYVYTNYINITHSQTQGDNVGFGFGDSSNRFPLNSIVCELYGGWTGKWYLWRSYVGGTNTNQLDTTTPAYSYGVVYRYEIIYAGSSSAKLYRDGVQIGTIMTSGLPTSPMGIFINIGDTTGYQNSYYQFIRRYVSPEPTWGSISTEQRSVTLNINSTPSGGEVWLASPTGSSWVDQLVQTSTVLYVNAGTSYDIEVGKGGYQPWTLINICTGNCTAGSIYNIQATLVPLPGTLSISSTPSGAEIYINDTDTGLVTSPSGTTISEPPGTYNIRLTLSGYYDWTTTGVPVTTNTTTTVAATFAGSANITSAPSGASIYLDGSQISIGNTPLNITNLTSPTSGATSLHNYMLRLGGYADTSGLFTVTAGSTITIPVTFPGSLNITSIPTGAQIYIDGVLQ